MRAIRLVLGLGLLTVGCVAAPPGAAPAPEWGGDPVLVGAGDIGQCGSDAPERTARLLDTIPGTVFTAGDNAYPNGSVEDFERCYGRSWGRHRERTYPSVGNHEYRTPGASAYFAYFGAGRAGWPSRGYYSYDLGAWHIVALNSVCEEIGGCRRGSRQEAWLRADLEANRSRCTAAYFHHPLFSSGQHGGNPGAVRDLWRDLYAAHADVVVNGHDHDYERFAPQDPAGKPDLEHGIREFVVGTGGGTLHDFPRRPVANSEVRDARTYGVLKLTLHPDSYDWEFVPVAGGAFKDSGTTTCH